MAKYNDLTVGQSEACINRMGGWDNFIRFIGGQGRIVFDTILTLLRTVKISAQPDATTSKEYFKEAGTKWMGDNFKAEFLGLEIPATDETELAVRKLKKPSVDGPIITELGGEEKAEISVSQFRAFLMANHKSSEWFLFYLKGRNGKLWAVHAHWGAGDGGWFVGAHSVLDPSRWHADHRVVSRNLTL